MTEQEKELLEHRISWNTQRIHQLEQKSQEPDSWERVGQLILTHFSEDKNFHKRVINDLSDLRLELTELSAKTSTWRLVAVALGAATPSVAALIYIVLQGVL